MRTALRFYSWDPRTPGMIVRNYLRGWMILDIASTVPTYLFGSSDQVFRSEKYPGALELRKAVCRRDTGMHGSNLVRSDVVLEDWTMLY